MVKKRICERDAHRTTWYRNEYVKEMQVGQHGGKTNMKEMQVGQHGVETNMKEMQVGQHGEETNM